MGGPREAGWGAGPTSPTRGGPARGQTARRRRVRGAPCSRPGSRFIRKLGLHDPPWKIAFKHRPVCLPAPAAAHFPGSFLPARLQGLKRNLLNLLEPRHLWAARGYVSHRPGCARRFAGLLCAVRAAPGNQWVKPIVALFPSIQPPTQLQFAQKRSEFTVTVPAGKRASSRGVRPSPAGAEASVRGVPAPGPGSAGRCAPGWFRGAVCGGCFRIGRGWWRV